MDTNYVFMCGMVWCQFGEQEAGRELIAALQSTDPALRILARTMLDQARGSKELLGQALADRTISPADAGLCSFGEFSGGRIEHLVAGMWLPPASS
ncbi:MAG TPA: hypothetical protein VFA68_10115 [Terriglobales bacterium]|nr:hypothetical protein [Terriglobales bacterium]